MVASLLDKTRVNSEAPIATPWIIFSTCSLMTHCNLRPTIFFYNISQKRYPMFRRWMSTSTTNSIDSDAEINGKTRLTEVLTLSVNSLFPNGELWLERMESVRRSETLRRDRKLVLERALSRKTQSDVGPGSKKSGSGKCSFISIEILTVCNGHRGDGSQRRTHSSMIFLSHAL